MQFTSELVQGTGTILAFTCSKNYKRPYLLYIEFFCCGAVFLLTGFWILLFFCGIFWLVHRKQIIKETLFVMKGIGLQITKFSRDGSCSNLFFDNSEIREVVIKESMSPYNVRINIAIILLGGARLVIPFNDFQITLKEAKQVYQATRTIFLN
jgi:hypothetical protein